LLTGGTGGSSNWDGWRSKSRGGLPGNSRSGPSGIAVTLPHAYDMAPTNDPDSIAQGFPERPPLIEEARRFHRRIAPVGLEDRVIAETREQKGVRALKVPGAEGVAAVDHNVPPRV